MKSSILDEMKGVGNYEGKQCDKTIILELFGTEYNHWTVSLPVINFIVMLFMLICIRINNTSVSVDIRL